MAKTVDPIIKDKNVRLERLKYEKNKLPALFCYLGIIFNVVYYISIYRTNSIYFYKPIIFISVIVNLLFLLFGFLSSEGIKNYRKAYSYVLFGLAALQIVRIFIFPLGALHYEIYDGETLIGTAITSEQFLRCLIYLCISSFGMVASGLLGIYKINMLEGYNKKLLEQGNN